MYLVGLVVDAINKRIGSHSYIQVGVAQPLDGFINIGHSSQSHLIRRGKTESEHMHKRIQIKHRAVKHINQPVTCRVETET